QDVLKDDPRVSAALINAHESAALVALVVMQITGFFAWLGLWMGRRVPHPPNWNRSTVLILSIVTFGLMLRTSNLGGKVRHPEILNAPQASEVEAGPTIAGSWRTFVGRSSWVWPACETLHFVGLCMLLGVVLTLDLRMLGMGKSLS